MPFGALGALGTKFGALGAPFGVAGNGGGQAPGSAADLNFATGQYFGGTLASMLTNTNAVGGYVTDSAGVLHLIAANTLRIGSGTGLLIESSTNIAEWSQGAFGPDWTVVNTAVTDNTTTAPNGTSTASTVSDNATSGIHQLSSQQNISFTSGTTYTMSFFFKAGTAASIQLSFSSTCFSGLGYANFNLTTGVVVSTGGTLVASGIIPLANGWYRAWIAATATLTTPQPFGMLFNNNNSSATRAPSYVGTGISLSVWGAQVEVGSSPSSYIPTTSAAVTRTDNIAISGTLATTLAGATGTIVANTSSSKQSVAATLVDANGTVLLGKTSGNVGTTAVGATLSTGNTGTWTGANDLGLAWNASGGALQLNGGTVATDTTARTPSATFHLGSTSGSSAFFNGYITRLTAYTTKQASPQ
jgi:hypothetical protein